MTDAIDWSSLRDAYGAADRVGDLLAAADADDREIWIGLWSRLCHQGTVYSASYAALPQLTAIALRRDPCGYVEPLHLATAILASTDGPSDSATVRTRYAADVAALGVLAQSCLALANDSTEFIYALQACLATEFTTVWSTWLNCLANGELEFECPHCREHLLMDFESTPTQLTPFSGSGHLTVVPASREELRGAEARAWALSDRHKQPYVTAMLLDLFGWFRCPECRNAGRIGDALA